MDRREQVADVLSKLANGDAEGFLRAAGHALVDPLMDSLITGLRGPGPMAATAGIPPAAQALGLPPPAADATAPIAPDSDGRSAALQARIEVLEQANRGLQETIARVSRENEALRARPGPGPGRKRRRRSAGPDLVGPNMNGRRLWIGRSSTRMP